MILAIDSSSLVASVALVSEDSVVAEYTINLKKTHSQTLLPMIDEIFKMTGLDKKEIKAVAITGGPGSFTGLRIGAATAKGLALALGLDIISIPTIDVMAYNYNHCNKLICPIMDARRHQVYTGIYRCEETELETVMPQCAMAVEELVIKINDLNEDVVLLGDGVPAFFEEIDKNTNVICYAAKQHSGRQRAGTIGVMAWDKYNKGEVISADIFAPEYLRMSQAERERMENDKKNDH